MRVALYARVSTEEQVDNFSIDAQLRALRDHCSKEGWSVAGEYIDAGVSGRTDDRPDFRRMVKRAKDGEFDLILVHKFDRFFRNREKSAMYKRLLREKGVRVVSVSEPTDPDAAVSFMLEGVLEVFAEWYSINLSEETKKGKRERARNGLWNGRLPFGYRRGDDGVPRPVPEEVPVIKMAYGLYATGQYTDREVAQALNEAGYRTRPHWAGLNPERIWTKDVIRETLQKPFYLGEVTYKGERFPGQHQPIISDEIWRRCQLIRKDKYSRPTHTKRSNRTYLLAGILHCDSCGQRMRAGSGSGYRYYRDMPDRRLHGCAPGIRAEEIERQLEDEVVPMIQLPDDWRSRILAHFTGDTVHSMPKPDTASLLERQERLKELYEWGDINRAEYKRKAASIEAKLALSRPPKLREALKAGELLREFGKVWSAARPEEKKRMLGLMFQAVYQKDKQIVALAPNQSFYPAFFARSGDDGIRTRDLCLDRAACLATTPHPQSAEVYHGLSRSVNNRRHESMSWRRADRSPFTRNQAPIHPGRAPRHGRRQNPLLPCGHPRHTF